MDWSESARVRATLATILDPHVLLQAVRDADGTIVDFVHIDANDAALAHTRSTRDQLIGTRLLDVVPGQRESPLFEGYVHTVETGAPLALDGILYEDEMQDGAPRYFDVRGARFEDAVSVTFRDVTTRVEQEDALVRSEAHYRLLAEHASDVVFEADRDTVIGWVSPSVERVLGWTPEELIGRRAFDLVDAEVGPDPAPLVEQLEAGHATAPHFQLFATRDGAHRWMRVVARPVTGADGTLETVVVSLHDSQSEVVVRRAYDTLAAVNELIVRAADERELLNEMCEIAVGDGGYLFAWYARRGGEPECRAEPIASSPVHRDFLDEIDCTWSPGPRGEGPAGTTLRDGATHIVTDFDEGPPTAWRAAAIERGFGSAAGIPVFVDGEADGAWVLYARETDAFSPDALRVLEQMARQLGFGLARLRDGTRLLQSMRQRALLTNAVDQAGEAILVTDPAGTLVYVNPATTISSGYAANELLGRTPRVFKSGVHEPAFFAAMWGELTAGRVWTGTIVNRRKDGALYEEDVTISPVTDPDGSLIAYVGVKRDLTPERSLEAALSEEQRDRAVMVAIMDEVRPAETVEETAGAFCDAVCRLEGIDAASVLLLDPGGDLVVAGVANTHRPPTLRVGAPTPVGGRGWVEALDESGVRFDTLDEPEHGDPGLVALGRAARASGLEAVAGAPIRWEGETLGLVALGTATVEGKERLGRRSDTVAEVASLAGSLLGRQLAERRSLDAARHAVGATLRESRFHPEYQPVVDLRDSSVVGYEALTRFDDGTPPPVAFEQAAAIGLGSELEAACARAALEGARDLPAGAWLSLNFSPTALLDGTAAAVVATATVPVVVEITEHAVIDRYDEIRAAIAGCAGARSSVDDAGAGFASLRHILELAPSFVKLDVGLVHDIDRDPARQALAAGLVHFATQTGITLIAEGIETEAEAQVLRVLGVHLGQGYLLGRPAPAGGPVVPGGSAGR